MSHGGRNILRLFRLQSRHLHFVPVARTVLMRVEVICHPAHECSLYTLVRETSDYLPHRTAWHGAARRQFVMGIDLVAKLFCGSAQAHEPCNGIMKVPCGVELLMK